MVNLPCKEAYVSGWRACHCDCQATNPAALGAYVWLKRGEGIGACKTRPAEFCSMQQAGERASDQYSEELDDMNNAVSNNPAHQRYELGVDGNTAAPSSRPPDAAIH